MKSVLFLMIVLTPIYGISQLNAGLGLSFIPVISSETVMNYSVSSRSSTILAKDPTFELEYRLQLRSNLVVSGLYHLTLLEKDKLSYGIDVTGSAGVHLPWTEGTYETALMFSLAAHVFIENQSANNLIFGYKMSSGGLYMQHPIIGFSTPKTQFYLSSLRFKHYRQLSNGDLVTSKRIWEVGMKFFILDNIGK